MSAGIGNKYASYSRAERFLNPPEKSHRRDWAKNDLRSFKGKKTIIKYNQFRMLNQSQILTKEQWNEVGLTYRPDSKTPEYTVKRFINNEQVIKVADEQLAKLLTDNGITLDFLIKEKKDLIQLSKENKQLTVTLKTIESFENNLGINNKVTISETRQTNSNLVDNFNKAKQTITVTSEKQGQIDQNTNSINDDNGEKTRENTLPDAENEQKTENEG